MNTTSAGLQFTKHGTAGVIALAILSSSGVAVAQSSAQRETARELMTEGTKHSDAGEKAAALKSFEGAHSIMNVPSTGIALARALAAVGRLLDARDMALAVRRKNPRHPKPPANRGKIWQPSLPDGYRASAFK